MVASIGKIASPSQGVGYFEKDGYYTKDDGAHREASAWAGRGAAALGLAGPVDPEAFRRVLEGEVPGGRRIGRKELDGSITHRPGRDVTLSAPKSVSLMAMVGGDERVVAAHDRSVTATLGWIERNAIETRLRDKATGAMVRAGDQKMVAALFRHDTSRNLDPQLHTHCVIANMVQGEDSKWRTMVDDGLFAHQKAIGAIYRAELAQASGSWATASRSPTRTGGSRSRAFRARSSTPSRPAGQRSKRRWRRAASAPRRTTRSSRTGRRC